ncbi:hypothetical protein BH23PSE2_BH23PSE2_08780 [soil metagenome]
MTRPLTTLLSMAVALAAASPAFACGEGIFHMGDGLRYQGYLAPRPATVLIYNDQRAPSADRMAVYRGLAQAGHRLTVAHNAGELSQALRERRYDVVITSLDAVAAVTAATPSAATSPKLLPVVDRSQRNAADLRSRFASFLVDGASLGQYLKSINRLMGG